MSEAQLITSVTALEKREEVQHLVSISDTCVVEAEAVVVDNNDMYEFAMAQRGVVKKALKALEDQRKSVTDPLRGVIETLTGWFASAKRRLEQAVQIYDQKTIAYREEQERKAREAAAEALRVQRELERKAEEARIAAVKAAEEIKRKAEEEAEATRKKAAEDAAAILRQAQAAADPQEKARLETAAGAITEQAAVAAELLEFSANDQVDAVVQQAEVVADAIEQQAAVVNVPAVSAPKSSFGHTRKVWVAEVTDKDEMIKEIAAGNAPSTFVEPVQGAMNKYAQATGGQVVIKGVRFKEQSSNVSSRSRK